MDRNKVTSFFDNWQSDDAFIALPESEKALIVATAAHQGQKDKAGVDYIEHPKFIANNPAFDDETKAVGLLHDVPEDNTDFTLDDLSSVFSERVVAGVAAMKHEDGIPYFDYVEAGANNEDFRLIKAADNNHNMDRSRFPKGKIPSEGLLRKWDFVYPLCNAYLTDLQTGKFPIGTTIIEYIYENEDLLPELRKAKILEEFGYSSHPIDQPAVKSIERLGLAL